MIVKDLHKMSLLVWMMSAVRNIQELLCHNDLSMGRDIIRTGFPTANTISMSGYLGSEVPDTHHCLDSTTLSPYGLNCPAFLAH